MQQTGGHWVFYFFGLGNAQGSATTSGYPTDTWNSILSLSTSFYGDKAGCAAPLNCPPNTSYTNTVKSPIHFKAVWTQNLQWNTNTTPAPPSLTILYTATSHWKETTRDASKPVTIYDHGADNGFSDPEMQSQNGLEQKGESAGKHLRTYPTGAQGVVEDDFSQNTHLQIYSPGGVDGVLEANLIARVDDRNVVVTSSKDTTFHRALDYNKNPVPVANIPDSMGVIHGDLKAPAPSTLLNTNAIFVTYHAGVSGAWNDNSAYHWYDSLSGMSGAGQFSLSFPPPDFTAILDRSQAPPGSTTHGFISCIDSADGAKATGNEYYTFHHPYEDWTINKDKDIKHPLPFNTTPGDWQLGPMVDCQFSLVNSIKLGYKWTSEIDEKVSVGSDLSAGSEGAIAAKANVGIEVGKKDIAEITADYTFSGQAYTTIQWYIAQTWEEMAGTCSVWGTNGYTGDTGWTGTRGTNLSSTHYEITHKYPQP